MLASTLCASVGFSACANTPSANADSSSAQAPLPASDKEQIQTRIEQFVFAYNSGDFDQVTACMTAKTRNAFQALLSLLGGIAGSYTGIEVDLSDLFSLGIATESGDFMGLQISDIQINGNTAVATTKMNLVGGMENQTIYFEMVYEQGGWYIDDMTDTKQGVAESPEQSQTNITVSDCSLYDGFIRVQFTKDDDSQTYRGYVNNKGEIFYVESYDKEKYSFYFTKSVGKGCFYLELEEKSASNFLYIIVNSNGEEVASSENGAFDEIIGGGDGLVLVYKNTGNISKEEHSYGVMNAEDGSWVAPLTPLSNGRNLYLPYDGKYTHWGDGIFALVECLPGYNIRDIYFFDSKNNEYFYIRNAYIYGSFEKGELYGKRYNGWQHTYMTTPNISEERIEMPSPFILHRDGSFEEFTHQFSIGNEEILIDTNTENEFLKIITTASNTIVEYTEFPLTTITSYRLFENYILLTVNGADGKQYFTVINHTGAQVLKPRVYKNSVRFSENCIIYKTEEETNVIDLEGNLIASFGTEYFTVTVQNGLIYVEKRNYHSVLDLHGNPLTYTLQ